MNIYLLSVTTDSTTIFKKPIMSGKIIGFLKQQLVCKRSLKNRLGRNCALCFTFYLSTAISKILLNPKSIKNT